MRKIFIFITCSLFCSLFVVITTGVLAAKAVITPTISLSSKITDTNNRLTALEAKLEAKHNTLTTNISDINNKLATIEIRLAANEAQNNSIQNQIKFIEQNIEQLKKADVENKKSFLYNLSLNITNLLQSAKQNKIGMLSILTVIEIGLFVLLLLALIYFSFFTRNSSAELNNDNESIASKLNLARAYIDMGKEAEAQAILNEALTNSNSSERIEIENLLVKIKKS